MNIFIIAISILLGLMVGFAIGALIVEHELRSQINRARNVAREFMDKSVEQSELSTKYLTIATDFLVVRIDRDEMKIRLLETE